MKINDNSPTTNDENRTQKAVSSNAAVNFKPTISIRRRQTRRLNLQVEEERADSFDEYVRFVSECHGFPVEAGDVMNEILKKHFAGDNGFKQWRATRDDNTAATNPN